MVRLADGPDEPTDENEVVEDAEGATEDASERMEEARESVWSVSVPTLFTEALERETTPLGGLIFGGTSWTWRFRGWFDFDGGGLTMMKLYKSNQYRVSLLV